MAALETRRCANGQRAYTQAAKYSFSTLWTLAVLLIKLQVAIVERRELPVDEQLAHLCRNFQGIAGGYDHIRSFAGLYRAQILVETEDLCR